MGSEKGLKAVLVNGLGYFAGQVGLMLFSLFTFPLFTRVLSKPDYGLLSVTNSTLSMVGLLVGFGLPNAVVRFAPEYSKDKSGARYHSFNASVLAGAVALAALSTTLLLLGIAFAPKLGEFGPLLHALQRVAVVLVARSAMNIVLEFYRVARNVSGYNLLCFAQKILNVGCSIAGYVVLHSLEGLLLGVVVAEVFSAGLGIAQAYRLGYLRKIPLDTGKLRAAVRFSTPLMLGGICASAMNFGDRLFLQGYHGADVVAGYAVAYDMCLYIQILVMTSFRLSALPEIVSKYTESGNEEAARFLAKAFQYFSWLLVGVGFGSVAVGKQVLTLLASKKYTDSSDLLPILVPGILIGGVCFLFASGLYLKKRNDITLAVSATSTVVNIGLNYLLIPSMGARGAALATLITYLVQAITLLIISGRMLPVPFAVNSFLRTLGCGFAMFLAVRSLSLGPSWFESISMRVVVGVVVYGMLLLVLERPARELLGSVCAKRSLAN